MTSSQRRILSLARIPPIYWHLTTRYPLLLPPVFYCKTQTRTHASPPRLSGKSSRAWHTHVHKDTRMRERISWLPTAGGKSSGKSRRSDDIVQTKEKTIRKERQDRGRDRTKGSHERANTSLGLPGDHDLSSRVWSIAVRHLIVFVFG